jgi:hypothetical protein
MRVRCLAAVVVSLVLAAPAQAAVTAKVSIVSKRIVVSVKGAKPKGVTVVAGGKSYKLTKSGSKWRSKAFDGAAALAGTAVKIKLRSGNKTKTLSVKVAGAAPAPAPVAPAPVAPAPSPAGTPPLFPPPAAATTGNAAYDEIKGYFADSRFTDCPTGWPTCAVEERYSHFANSDQYYCRLTPSSGSDIKSYGQISRISGAEHHADGSWIVEYYLSSYGNTVFYSWTVSPYGVTTGRYWRPGRDPSSGPPDQSLGPLQWVRGARDCSS